MSNSVKKFKKKPIVIHAVQYTGDNGMEISHWSRGEVVVSPALYYSEAHQVHHTLHIHTPEGIMTANPGTWVIQGVHGEFYPCQDYIFRETHEVVEDEPKSDVLHSLAKVEEDHIRRVLRAVGGNKTKAAQVLEMDRRTLYRKLAKMKHHDVESVPPPSNLV